MSPFSIPPFPALNLLSLSFFFILLPFFCHFLAFLPHSFLPSSLFTLFTNSPILSANSTLFIFVFPSHIWLPSCPPPHPLLHHSFTTDGPKADIDSSNKVGVYTLINISALESGWCSHKASERAGTSCNSAC